MSKNINKTGLIIRSLADNNCKPVTHIFCYYTIHMLLDLCIPDSKVVVDHQTLEELDQAALQITCRVNI